MSLQHTAVASQDPPDATPTTFIKIISVKSGTRQLPSTYGYRRAGQADENVEVLKDDAKKAENLGGRRGISLENCVVSYT